MVLDSFYSDLLALATATTEDPRVKLWIFSYDEEK